MMRMLLGFVVLFGCSSEEAPAVAASGSPPAASAASTATATVTATAAATASASAAAPEKPLNVRAAKAQHAKAERLKINLDDPKGAHFPYDVLSAYATNELKADATYKGKPAWLGGLVREVGRDGGRVYVVLGDQEESPQRQLELKLRKVKLFLDEADGTSVEFATAVENGQLLQVICDAGDGLDDLWVTFSGCTIWGPLKGAAASASVSAKP